jgi:glycosyltransferase involved in cell wall biosynthesis
VKIAFVYAGGREARWSDALAGKVPTDFFYGAVELAKSGRDVDCIDAPEPRRSLLAAVWNRLLGWCAPVRTRGEHVAAVARILPRLKTADAVVAASTSHANALAIWKGLGFLQAPIVGIHCGHVNFPYAGARLRSTVRALRRQEIVLFADAERAETIRQFEVDPRRVHANSFGVDTEFWTPAAVSRDYVLAVGNDGRRDYATLVSAVADMNVTVKILTARPLPEPLPRNVEHLRGTWHTPAVTDEELRDLYRHALLVVVPLEDAIQPSGQSVALQAMACGRPVLLSSTRGLWTGDDFQDGRDFLLVEPSSPPALRLAIQRLLDDPTLREQIGVSARGAVAQHGRIGAFAERLQTILTAAKS